MDDGLCLNAKGRGRWISCKYLSLWRNGTNNFAESKEEIDGGRSISRDGIGKHPLKPLFSEL
jgi:hypothetical protein